MAGTKTADNPVADKALLSWADDVQSNIIARRGGAGRGHTQVVGLLVNAQVGWKWDDFPMIR